MTNMMETYISKSDMTLNPTSVTSISFFGTMEVLVVSGVNKLVYRSSPNDIFSISPISNLSTPHTIKKRGGVFYLDDTGNNRLVRFENIENGGIQTTTKIAGKVIYRPHYTLYNPDDDFLYVIDRNGMLYRFKDFGVNEEVVDLSSVAGYSRSMFLKDGKVHLVNSSQGKIVRVNDFLSGSYDQYISYGKKKEASSGSWEETGFVINHVCWYNNYFYASNYFSKSYANGTNPNINKLVRFKTLEDLTIGAWEDISESIPADFLPYFFTINDGNLYVSGWDDEDRASGNSKILREVERPDVPIYPPTEPFKRRSRVRINISEL